ELVADPSLTIRCCPLSDDLTAGYHTYGTGFVAQDTTVVEKGLLQTFMLSQFGANKLGMARAVNGGGCTIIEPGDCALEDMIKDVTEGIFINRFSGGRPNDQGEFSGIAKNSYYIKDGEIQFPIQETTISGNLAASLKNITAISRERLNSGASNVPWVQISGITAS
ncbi:MAG: metallopeptidase TldD-related protein, partial [Pseudomonadota bacterium]